MQKQENEIVSTLREVPVTVLHKPPKNLEEAIFNPAQPRANLTVDREHPKGIYTPPQDLTVIQQHLAFFDSDNDGVIWPRDTFNGFRSLGFNMLLSIIAVLIIHPTFSFWSLSSWIPHPGFPISIKNAHRLKHGSDSESYDTEGRFIPQKFEEIFSKYGKTVPNALTLREINSMVWGNRNISDFIGWTASFLEWNLTYYLAAKTLGGNGTKMLTKDSTRRIIDGTLFYSIEREIKSGRLKRESMFRAGLKPVAAGDVATAASPFESVRGAVSDVVGGVKKKLETAQNKED